MEPIYTSFQLPKEHAVDHHSLNIVLRFGDMLMTDVPSAETKAGLDAFVYSTWHSDKLSMMPAPVRLDQLGEDILQHAKLDSRVPLDGKVVHRLLGLEAFKGTH